MGYGEDNAKVAKHLPSDDLDICEENFNEFFRTMFERQEIWYKRFMLKQERPWTEDKFFKDYKFTNVYRELDRNSQFQIEHFFKGAKSRKEMLWEIMFFRFFNNPEFFKFIEDFTLAADIQQAPDFSFVGMIPRYEQFKPEELKVLMEAYRTEGGNPFTNAYLTNSQACPGCTRDECFAFKVIPTLHRLIPEISLKLISAKTPEEIIKLLMTLPSVSNFMAHEFYQDFTYAPRYSKFKLMKFDQDDFTNVGPGAEVGIRLIFPNRKTKAEKEQAIWDLRDLAKDALSQFGEFKYLDYDREKGEYFINNDLEITGHCAEMHLCEFQKYWKMKVGEGKQRSKFIEKTHVQSIKTSS